MKRHILGVTMLAGAALLAACGGGSEPSALGAQSGRLNLKIGDAAVDGASAVVIVFTGVELQPASGERVNIDFAAPREVDLLAYQNGATVNLLENQIVPAGDYNWMRLKVIAERNRSDGSYIEFLNSLGTKYPLYVPSGSETGLKLNRPFRVAAGSITRLVADFDLRKSIIKPPGQEPNYVLKPVLRLMDELETGTLEGSVDFAALAIAQLGETATAEQCKVGVYVFTGGTATPDDADGDSADDGGVDPLVYMPVPYDGVNSTAGYTVAFLATGTYTVAATCNFDIDVSPEDSEYNPNALDTEAGYQTMKWTTVENVVINANQTTAVDFPLAP